MTLGFITLEIYKIIGFPLVSHAVSCISDLTQGENSAHGSDIFSYLHPNCTHYMQQSYNRKCTGELMKAELQITSVFYGTFSGHCPSNCSNIYILHSTWSWVIVLLPVILLLVWLSLLVIVDVRDYIKLFYSPICFLMHSILQ